MKSITFPQVIILLAVIAAPIVAYKLLGSAEGSLATSSLGSIILFLLGRPADPAPDTKGGAS